MWRILKKLGKGHGNGGLPQLEAQIGSDFKKYPKIQKKKKKKKINILSLFGPSIFKEN